MQVEADCALPEAMAMDEIIEIMSYERGEDDG